MSRQAANSAEANRATLKALVKLEANKSCADCKRNKHPRWASWNIGVFICIRCSGIHRGLGTHISRVKSVDLDTWTDEQMQSMLKWGNARANRYWEAKLAEGHVPNEAKIENFIRTKYDSKRWVMDGPMPDPSTLGSAATDDDVPLNVVQENLKAKMGSQHARNGSIGGALPQPPRVTRQPQVDLFGDDTPAAAAAPSQPRPSASQPAAAKAPAAPPKQTRPGESLLGLDFFGGAQTAPPARAATTSPTGGPARSDLKQSILSLYASKPATPVPQSPAANAFGGMQSPPLASPAASNSAALGGLGDAFSSLSFSNPAPQQSTPAYSNFTQPQATKPATSLVGGGFFDSKPSVPPKAAPAPQLSSFDSDFGDFSSAASPAITSKPATKPGTSSMGDLFDLSTPAPAPPPKPTSPPAFSSSTTSSAFNLSSQPKPTSTAAPVKSSSAFNNMDAWGTSGAWAIPDPAPAPAAAPAPPRAAPSISKPAVSTPSAMFDSGWGNEPSSSSSFAKPAATSTTTSAGGFSVQQDEEFGGWTHASPVATPSASKPSAPAATGGGSDDLFGNVWG